MTEKTTVHLLRHGEVHNPKGVLYGRMDGYHLSDLGQEMARVVAEAIKDRDITHLREFEESGLGRRDDAMAGRRRATPARGSSTGASGE